MRKLRLGSSIINGLLSQTVGGSLELPRSKWSQVCSSTATLCLPTEVRALASPTGPTSTEHQEPLTTQPSAVNIAPAPGTRTPSDVCSNVWFKKQRKSRRIPKISCAGRPGAHVSEPTSVVITGEQMNLVSLFTLFWSSLLVRVCSRVQCPSPHRCQDGFAQAYNSTRFNHKASVRTTYKAMAPRHREGKVATK